MRLMRWMSSLLLLLLGPTGDLRAQTPPRTITRALDVGLGVGYGYGGPPLRHRGQFAAGVLLSEPIRALRHGALLFGVNGSLNLPSNLSDCVTDLGISPRGCRDYPGHVGLSVLGGWARRDDQGSGVRVFAGPGYFHTMDDRNGIGLTARVDGAERMSSRLSFVFWAQGHLPPSPRGERLSTLTAGIGLRVH